MDHHEAEWRLADLAQGYLSDPEADAVEAHVDACPMCRRTFARVQALLVTRSSAAPLPTASSPRDWWRPVTRGLLLAAIAVLAVLITPRRPDVGVRGAQGSEEVSLTLALAIQHGEVAERFHRDHTYAVGDQVLFHAAASPAGPVYLWVRTGDRLTTIAGATVPPEGEALTRDGSPVTWRIEEPLPHTFFLSASGYGECTPGCAIETVRVTP